MRNRSTAGLIKSLKSKKRNYLCVKSCFVQERIQGPIGLRSGPRSSTFFVLNSLADEGPIRIKMFESLYDSMT